MALPPRLLPHQLRSPQVHTKGPSSWSSSAGQSSLSLCSSVEGWWRSSSPKEALWGHKEKEKEVQSDGHVSQSLCITFRHGGKTPLRRSELVKSWGEGAILHVEALLYEVPTTSPPCSKITGHLLQRPSCWSKRFFKKC